MSSEEQSPKRLKVDDGYIAFPSPSPLRISARPSTPSLNAVVLYEPITPVKKNPVSLTELVTSRTVTINVGPEKNNVNVSTSLFQGISEPLHQLLNSVAVAQGDVSEIDKYLQYDDKDAFLQLISMAYNTILKGPGGVQMSPNFIENEGTLSSSLIEIEASIPKVVKCRDCAKGNLWLDVKCDSGKSVCKAPKLAHDYGLQFFFELQLFQSHSLAAYISSKQISQFQHPDPINSATGKPYPLIHFAKVFNLAAKWQVVGLQHTSLLGFQNRLKRYAKANPDDKTLEELLDVLRYLASSLAGNVSFIGRAASWEARTEMDPARGMSMLLRSLMRYICVHVSALLQDVEFRQIVVDYGVIGLILFEVLEETLVASKGGD